VFPSVGGRGAASAPDGGRASATSIFVDGGEPDLVSAVRYPAGMPESISTRPLLDKLGVAPGSTVCIGGVDDPAFRAALADRPVVIVDGDAPPGATLVFLAAGSPADLAILPDLARRIDDRGAIWVVSRKGKAATLRDVEVIAAAKAAGLVDNKVVAFSATHTALRLVVPVALRSRRSGGPPQR
jgi:hypothetical protein